jgi:hypothetical protein
MIQSSFRRPVSRVAILVAAAVTAPAALRAQLAGGSPVSAGMGGNFLAAARGAEAVEWNPANLALHDNPKFTLRALSVGGVSALSPVSWGDVASFGGQSVSREVRQRWLDRITEAGGESGEADGGLTILALSVGRFGMHVGAAGYAKAEMSPDATEALLFGNAGRSGEARDLRFAGSGVRGGAFATTALSYGQPMVSGNGGELSFGVTAKYVVGGGMARAEDHGSAITASTVAVDFPVVHSSADGSPAGSGMGLDLGAAWRAGRVTRGAKVENAVNTFAWDAAKLRYRAVSAEFDGENSASSFDAQEFAGAPAALRAAVEGERFAPALNAGLAFHQSEKLHVTADARYSLGGEEAITLGPKHRVGVGLESRAIGFLPVRLGGAAISGGWQGAAGAGIKLGAFELAASYTLRKSEHGSARGLTVGVVSLH